MGVGSTLYQNPSEIYALQQNMTSSMETPRESVVCGSVDLSLARAHNGGPLSLSVRDAPTINSLLAGPPSPRAAPRPRVQHKVDALLERLAPHSPHTVIVSAHAAASPPPPAVPASAGASQEPCENGAADKTTVKRRMSEDLQAAPIVTKTRRKTCSESETIDNIAAMIASTESVGEEAAAVGDATLAAPPEAEAKSVDNLKSVLSSPTATEAPLEPPVEAEAAPEPVDPPSRADGGPTTADSEPATATHVTEEAAPSSTFVEVESELEKMFAGIEEAPTPGNAPPPPPAPARRKSSRRSSEVPASGEEPPVAAKRKMPRKPKGSDRRNWKETMRRSEGACRRRPIDVDDSGSNASSSRSRGPYVQVRGPRDSPLAVNVVNAPAAADEDAERPRWQRQRAPPDADFRSNLKSKGLHCSTLSVKYDATTADASWVCVFCKLGPHAASPAAGARPLGDLFGPYAVAAEHEEGERTPPRRRRSRGETEAGLAASGTGYEVWMHEECAVWAPGLLVVGGRVVGLEGAVWGCWRATCAACGRGGAGVACVRRGCTHAAHVGCARAQAWCLLHDDYRAFCPQHLPQP